MISLQFLARAKINLALHVVGQRDDGYHLLDTIVTFAELGDQLSIEPSEQLELTTTGPHAAGLDQKVDNLVIRAAHMLQRESGNTRLTARLRLCKTLPVASGLGGGSADAAAAMRGLNQFWKLGISGPRLRELALKLGADVPMCVIGRPAHVRGIGEAIEPVTIPALPIVLVNPHIPVSTPGVFKCLSDKSNPPLPPLLKDKGRDGWVSYLQLQRNDLQGPAISLTPEIKDCLAAISELPGCQLARLSGSGATCFAVFESDHDAEAAASTLRDDHSDWWVVQSKTITGELR